MSTPIAVTTQIVGGMQVETKFLTDRTRVTEEVTHEVQRLTTRLQTKVKQDKLSGQVLHRRTGRLSRSINKKVVASGAEVTGSVGTNVDYGKIWELTGTPAMDIYPVKAKALRWFGAGGDPVFAAHVHKAAVGPKPFLLPALEEMRPEIQFRLARAAFLGIA